MSTNTSKAASADFIKNLGRMYGAYTGGFLAFIVLLAILMVMNSFAIWIRNRFERRW